MSAYYLAAGTTATTPVHRPPAVRTREPIPTLTLESMDGNRSIKLDGSMGWILMPGATGLKMAPVTSFYRNIPGVHGSLPSGMRIPERKVFLPLYGRGDTQREYHELLDAMFALIDPHHRHFKIVATTVRGSRELICRYDGGLEGDDAIGVSGLNWCKVGMRLTAFSPFARARTERRLVFRSARIEEPFLGVVGGSDAPWPGALSSSAVIGEGMEVSIASEVPVHPRLDLVGPMDSFTGSMEADEDAFDIGEWRVEIPTGVPASSTFTLVTDGHQKSARLDGQLAAGRISLDSTLRPFQPGTNVLNVIAPGGTSDTRIIIAWHELFWSLW